jgi:hypothetical protein
MPDPTTPEHREPAQIKIHMLPPGFDLAGGRWAAVPLDVLAISGKVLACLNCGSVVAPDLMDVHERTCVDA